MDNEPTPPAASADPHAWLRRRRDHRQRLMDVAYRMLGSVSDAEEHGAGGLRPARAERRRRDRRRARSLVTVTSRLCLDQLRSAQSQRTSYVGPWMPEPVVDVPSLGVDPADRVTLDDSVRMALLVVLEQLSPAERTAFVLHDVFQLSFEEVASIVGRSPAACRAVGAAPGATSRPKPPAETVPRRRRRATAARGRRVGRGEQWRPRGAARGVGPRRVGRRRLRRSHPRCTTPRRRRPVARRRQFAAQRRRPRRHRVPAPWTSTANPVSSACRTGGSSPRSCSRSGKGISPPTSTRS